MVLNGNENLPYFKRALVNTLIISFFFYELCLIYSKTCLKIIHPFEKLILLSYVISLLMSPKIRRLADI